MNSKNLIAKFIVFIFAFAFIEGNSYAQSNSRQLDFHVKGVRIGSTYSFVIKKLGRTYTRKIKHLTGEDSCTGEDFTMYFFRYDGLNLAFITTAKQTKRVLIGIEITSKQWQISKVRVGTNSRFVRRKLGKPDSIEKSAGTVRYYYNSKDMGQQAEFEFKNDRLIRISREELIC